MNIRQPYQAKSAFLSVFLTLLMVWCWQTAAVAQVIKTIDPREAAGLIQQEQENADFVILDLRTPPEFQQGRLQQAVLLDYYSKTFVDNLKQLDKNKIYLVYCRSGNRSGRALSIFEQLGFTRVYNMADGINGWIRAGLPVIR
jgi:rhodanese-related sulfurtransferase